MRLRFLFVLFMMVSGLGGQAQELTQNIGGYVVEKSNEAPIPGVKIHIENLGIYGITNEDGYYTIKDVPLGIHHLSFSIIGFQTQYFKSVEFTSGKEVILNVGMEILDQELNEVVIQNNQAGRPLNEMATISARSIDIKESQRFPGSIDDISRIVTSFAGVTGSPSAQFNSITVRGNSSNGVKYQLEGIELLNPNHIGARGGTSGFMSVVSANALDQFDFYNGAFPAEFGNATASIFDLKLRNGNLNHYEHSFSFSVLGIDFFSEGPLRKGKTSYLFNYRYSTFGLISRIAPTGIPIYQDLSMKIHHKTEKAGNFNFFFIGGLSEFNFIAKTDSTQWLASGDRVQRKQGSDVGALGVNHKITLGKKSFLQQTILLQAGRNFDHERYLEEDLTFSKRDSINNLNYRLGFHSRIQTKFSRRHTNKTGIRFDGNLSNLFGIRFNPTVTGFDTLVRYQAFNTLAAIYTQSKFTLTEKLRFTAGVHGNYNTYNEELSVEPRIGLNYIASPKTKINFGSGLYSKTESDIVYYSNYIDFDGNKIERPNENLRLQKSAQVVAGVDHSFSKEIRLKTEAYYQYIFNAPASSNSGFSTLTFHNYDVPALLDATATGTNYGLEATLEGYFNLSYFVLSGTIFDSKYISGDGIERNTEFNTNYSANLVFGKRFKVGQKKGKNNVIGSNFNIIFLGGSYYTPVDLEESIKYQITVFDATAINAFRRAPTFRIDYSFSYRFNRPKFSGNFFVQVKNLYTNNVVTFDYFDLLTQSVQEFYDFGLVPILGIRFDF